jgi:hypothetical protein
MWQDEPLKSNQDASDAGRFVNDCPQLMDVRSMNREEVDTWMEQLSARMDEINLLAPVSTSEESEVSHETEILD